MEKICCGIDFGTSNTSVAVAGEQVVNLVPLEGPHVTIPSALFFPKGEKAVYGRAAVNMFMENKDGHFMRSLKRILGTPLMKHGTSVNGKPFTFERIISLFLQNAMSKTTAFVQREIEGLVLGRPVHFTDKDPGADKRAERELYEVGRTLGFKNIAFQFEPIAAAFAHEVNLNGEKLAIVIDLGGGTSDFTIIRLSKAYIRKPDRAGDILANTGVRVGGNDFDKHLSLASIMPELGYLSTYGEKRLEVPMTYYHNLAEWSKVNFLYTNKVLSQVRQYVYQSHSKKRLGRLLRLLEIERGHAVLGLAEQSKIELTAASRYEASMPIIDEDLWFDITRIDFEAAIAAEVQKIVDAATDCLKAAGLTKDQIELVILTGGTTEVPLVQNAFRDLFPQAEVADENRLSSVGLGLAYDSRRKFA